mgnify:CR=1 FL=1
MSTFIIIEAQAATTSPFTYSNAYRRDDNNDYRATPARIVKVADAKYVRRAYARANEWLFEFTLPNGDKVSTVAAEVRVFSSHVEATRALLLDGDLDAQRDTVEAARRVARNQRNDARDAADATYREALDIASRLRTEARSAADQIYTRSGVTGPHPVARTRGCSPARRRTAGRTIVRSFAPPPESSAASRGHRR